MVGEEETDEVIAGNEGEAVEGDVVLRQKEVVKSGYAEEDVAAAWLRDAGDGSSTDRSLDDPGADQAVKVNSASGGESRQDEVLGTAMEVVSPGQVGEIRMELGEDIAAGEGEVDETVGEVEGGVEEGQAGVSRCEEVVNSVQGETVNVNKDTAVVEVLDESNGDQSFVKDAEDQVAVVEKVFHLIYWVILRWDIFPRWCFQMKCISRSLTLSSQ